MKKTFTTAFNRSAESIRDISVTKFNSPSKVKKSLSYATDINKIYEELCKTGKAPLNGATPIYDENFVKYDSLIEAQKLVDDASLYFSTLPANIKNQYGNSLAKFVQAVNDKDEFLINQGLLNIPAKSDVDVPVVDSVQPVTPTIDTHEVNTATTD